MFSNGTNKYKYNCTLKKVKDQTKKEKIKKLITMDMDMDGHSSKEGTVGL